MQDVIKKIKNTEATVRMQKLDAEKQAGEKVSQAKVNGKKLIETAIANANKDAEKIVKQAEEQAATQADEKVGAAKKEADEILRIAQGRMDQAARVIVEGIVGHI